MDILIFDPLKSSLYATISFIASAFHHPALQGPQSLQFMPSVPLHRCLFQL